ncbi:MAG: hypothetical protein HN691_13190 [Bacteroidetes bacterium]|nr:hypothetical protein [Bacteroidota bacterium]
MFNSLINVKRIIFITILSSLSITGFSQKYSDEEIKDYCDCFITHYENVFWGRLVKIEKYNLEKGSHLWRTYDYKFKIAIDTLYKGINDSFIWFQSIDEYGFPDSSEIEKSNIFRTTSYGEKSYSVLECQPNSFYPHDYVLEIDAFDSINPILQKMALNKFSKIFSGTPTKDSPVFDTFISKSDTSKLVIKERKIEFQVYEWFNGDAGTDKTFVYTLPLDANGLNFKIGEDYLVYAEKTNFINGEVRYRAMKPTSLSLPLKFADKHIEILRDFTQK